MNIGTNEKVSLPSGAVLEMTMAPFLEGRRLLGAVSSCIKSVKVDSSLGDASNLNSLKDVFLSCLTSREVEDALLDCLKGCTYNGQRITSWDIFDDLKAREDYMTICVEVCKFNLAPFTKNLLQLLSGILKTKTVQDQL